MAKKKKQMKREKEDRYPQMIDPRIPWHADVHPEIKKTVLAIVFFVIAGIFVLSFIGKSGNAGGFIYTLFDFLLGKGYFFAPLMLIILGFSLIASGEKKVIGSTMLGGAIFLVASLSNLEIVFGNKTGGFIGMIIGSPLVNLFDFWASLLIVNALFAISLLLLLNMPFWKNMREEDEEEAEELDPAVAAAAGVKNVLENINATIKTTLEGKDSAADAKAAALETSVKDKEKEEASLAVRKLIKRSTYKKPPLELLQGDRGKPSSGDIKANANIIKRTFENFGIDVEMGEVSIGPTVTQYTLRPAEGVKLARITALGNDLSLALAAHPIRIEAPIPGKSLVGIEVPNRSIALVGLRTLLEHEGFTETSQPLLFAIGRDVTGAPVYADLAKMPHLLISGATGSGKSVSMHSIMTSFLYRNPPELLRFIIVDPKRVELSVYNDIPHLLTPVITDSKKTVQALRWAAKEMDRRYDLLSTRHSRDIISYNTTISKEGKREDGREPELLPYIVIIIDELADIMLSFPREVEASIVRLAQMSRAVGIHLIVATQRPSVEVITGLIKANIPSRIAFQVASQIDSRTILDGAGAEKLLGSGDMLFLAGDMGKPRRIQGSYLSEQEVKRVVDFLREESTGPEFNEGILETKMEEEGSRAGSDGLGSDEDPLYDQAQDLVTEAGKASASYLQRRLRVGYARAARLLDLLEQNGVIGPGDGAKPREVLAKPGESLDGESFET
ncbi:MAG: DNA translocase FtsK [bacterium]|nr:DNA translocase FtsK [bacterium]